MGFSSTAVSTRATLPVFGSMSTRNRATIPITVQAMPTKQESHLRQVVARNVQALLDRDFPGKRGQHSRFCKKRAGIALSRMQNASKDGGINMATLARIATAFGVLPYQMLIDGLNVKEPQIAIEKRYYMAAKQIAKDLAEAP